MKKEEAASNANGRGEALGQLPLADATKYMFISTKMAKRYPDLVECCTPLQCSSLGPSRTSTTAR